MDPKIPDGYAVALAEKMMKSWEDHNGHLDGHEVQRALLLDTVLTARAEHNDLPVFGVDIDGDGQPCDYDDEKGQALVKRAIAGDADADAVLCGIAARFILSEKKMPKHLHFHTFYVLMSRRDAPPPTPKRHAKMGRNVAIVGVVDALQRFGFRPTRNRATRAQRSGCSIVAEALSKMGFPISEAGVEDVWGDRARLTPQDFTVRD